MNETTDITTRAESAVQQAAASEASHDLIIEPGGSVTLPCTRAIEKSSPEFHAILRKTVPDDICNELSDLMANRRSAYSRIQIAVCVLLFAGTLALAWLFFPRSASPATASYANIDNPYGIQSGRYRDLAKEISVLVTDEKKPQAALQAVSPHLEEIHAYISESKDQFRECRHLILDIANCERQVPRPRAGAASSDYGRIQAILKKAAEYEPDEFNWDYLGIELQSKLLLPINQANYATYASDDISPLTGRRIERALKDIERFKEKIKPLRDQKVEFSENQLVMLDLIQARLLVKLWHINGGNTLPDDLGDPGVAERELAWKITLQHPAQTDFLLIQEYILNTLLEHDSYVNQVYFNGKSVYDTTALKNQLTAVRDQLKRN